MSCDAWSIGNTVTVFDGCWPDTSCCGPIKKKGCSVDVPINVNLLVGVEQECVECCDEPECCDIDDCCPSFFVTG